MTLTSCILQLTSYYLLQGSSDTFGPKDLLLPLASECRHAYFFKETTDPKKVHPNLIREFPIEQSGRCNSSGRGNQREPNTFPRRILLGLSFDALFSPIRRVPPALCRSRCFKNRAGLHSRPKQPLPTPLLALPVTTKEDLLFQIFTSNILQRYGGDEAPVLGEVCVSVW